MPVQVDIEYPDDNIVLLSSKFINESSGFIKIYGRSNIIQVEDPYKANTACFTLTGGAIIKIGVDSNLNGLQVFALAKGAIIDIGAWSSFNGTSQITAHEKSIINIGASCLFGHGCNIASSDVHKVLDTTTRERINPPGDIAIGEHVWLAAGVMVLRNAVIGRDSVVGAGSIVRDKFPANVSLAGAPARVIRTGITWEF